MILAPFATIPLVLVTIDLEEFVSFSTWVCLAYGLFFGLLFCAYECRGRQWGKKANGNEKHLQDWITEQYGFMQIFEVRAAFLICLGFFMGGAGPLGWAVASFCFLHAFFACFMCCCNPSLREEVKEGTFSA